jgi:hypothetical protein
MANPNQITALDSLHLDKSATAWSIDEVTVLLLADMFGTRYAKQTARLNSLDAGRIASLLETETDGWITSRLVAESRYDMPMKTPPDTPEFVRFTTAMRDILKVSKSQMQARIETQKESGKRLSKGASLGSAASSKVRSSFGNS